MCKGVAAERDKDRRRRGQSEGVLSQQSKREDKYKEKGPTGR